MCKESVLWQVLRTLSEPFLSVPYSPENSQSLNAHWRNAHFPQATSLHTHLAHIFI